MTDLLGHDQLMPPSTHSANDYPRLYKAMTDEIGACGQDIVCCYRIARYCRERLPLAGVNIDPVDYFKRWLPLFEAEMLYYERRQKMETATPTDDLQEWKERWVVEYNHLNDLIGETPGLYDYHQQQATDRDRELFGPAAMAATRNAHTLAGFIAFTRYNHYLEHTFPQFFNPQR